VDDETGPLEIAIIEDTILVADEGSEPDGAIVVDSLSPVSGLVELTGDKALVVNGPVGLRVEETEVMGSTDDTSVGPPVANSFVAAGLKQKLAIRRARAFDRTEHIMVVVLDRRVYVQWRVNMRGD
jgi:hypothetical protein